MWAAAAALGVGALNFLGNERNNAANAQQAEENRNFQAGQSATAHQREVEDLRAAGLNPILSSKYGGASTPVGSVAHMTNSMGEAANSGLRTYEVGLAREKLNKEVDVLETQAGLNRALQGKAMADEELAHRTGQKMLAGAGLDEMHSRRINYELRDLLPSQKNLNLASSDERSQMASKIGYELEKVLPTEARILIEELKGAVKRGEVDATLYGRVMEYVKRLPGVGGVVGGFGAGVLADQYRRRSK